MSDDSLTQYQIIVSGNIQRVGFRDKVDDLAFDFSISGYVENRPKKEAFILAQGNKQNLEQFCQKVQKLELPVKVQSLRITEHPWDEKYQDFSVIRGKPIEELAERFDTAVYFLNSIDRKQDQMLGKQDQIIDLQKESICIQSKTLDEVHALRTDLTEKVMAEV